MLKVELEELVKTELILLDMLVSRLSVVSP